MLEVVCRYTLLPRLYRHKIFGENKTALNNRPKRPQVEDAVIPVKVDDMMMMMMNHVDYVCCG